MSFKKCFMTQKKYYFFSFLIFLNCSILDASDAPADYDTTVVYEGDGFQRECQRLTTLLTALKTKGANPRHCIDGGELKNIKCCMESISVNFKEKLSSVQLDILEAHMRIVDIIKRRSDRMNRYTALLAKSDSISPTEMQKYINKADRTETLEQKTTRVTKLFNNALKALCDYNYYSEQLGTQNNDEQQLEKFKKSWAFEKRRLDEIFEKNKNNTSSIRRPKSIKENLLTFPLSFYVAGFSLGFQITHNAPAILSKRCIDLFLAHKITDTAAFNRAIDFALLQHHNAKNVGYLALGSIAIFAAQRILSAESIVEKKESLKEYFKKEHLFMGAAGVVVGVGTSCFISNYVKNQLFQA